MENLMSREPHITRYKIWSGKALDKKENKELYGIEPRNIRKIKNKIKNLESFFRIMDIPALIAFKLLDFYSFFEPLEWITG